MKRNQSVKFKEPYHQIAEREQREKSVGKKQYRNKENPNLRDSVADMFNHKQ